MELEGGGVNNEQPAKRTKQGNDNKEDLASGPQDHLNMALSVNHVKTLQTNTHT